MDPHKLVENILRNYFKHQNYQSFLRYESVIARKAAEHVRVQEAQAEPGEERLLAPTLSEGAPVSTDTMAGKS